MLCIYIEGIMYSIYICYVCMLDSDPILPWYLLKIYKVSEIDIERSIEH